MSDLISKIRTSTPTHVGEDALNMVLEIFSDQNYAIVSSAYIGLPMTLAVAESFIDSIAATDVPGQGTLKIYHPLYIAQWTDEGTNSVWVLFYGNGHVVYVEDPDPYLYVLIHKDVLSMLQIPTDTPQNIVDKMIDYVKAMPEEVSE